MKMAVKNCFTHGGVRYFSDAFFLCSEYLLLLSWSHWFSYFYDFISNHDSAVISRIEGQKRGQNNQPQLTKYSFHGDLEGCLSRHHRSVWFFHVVVVLSPGLDGVFGFCWALNSVLSTSGLLWENSFPELLQLLIALEIAPSFSSPHQRWI